MSGPIYFLQGCPVCGRRLQIRVEYLGRKVVCQHCQGEFLAADPANMRVDAAEYENTLLRRADELLESVAQRRPNAQAQPRAPYPR